MSIRRFDLHRFRDQEDPSEQAQVLLEASQAVAQQGGQDEARRLAQSAAETDPQCADAWLHLAWLTKDVNQRMAHLGKVLHLEPDHVEAQGEMAQLRPPSDNAAFVLKTGRHPWRWWAVGLVALALVLLIAAFLVWGPVNSSLAGLLPTPTPAITPTPTLTPGQVAVQFVPQLQAAVDDENWDRALDLVAIMQGVDPTGDEVQKWALETHMQAGQALVEAGENAKAQAQFDQAVALAPTDDQVLLWQSTTQMYLAGQEALALEKWAVAVESFTRVYEQLPEYGDVFDRLVDAYSRQGEAAISDENWTEAIDVLSQAAELVPDKRRVTGLLSFAYRGQAQTDLDEGKLTAAIEKLVPAHEHLPEDQQITDLLASTYRQRGIIREEKGQLEPARTDLEAALELRPGDAEAQTHLDKVMYRLFPPKRIEIDISQQMFYAWEGDVLVYSFVTSTGLRGRDTAPGHYQVLDKIPNAYSSVWRLTMPYWLGIYWVGNIENGIHALPIRPDGSVMWGGLLGQQASYGCVILSTEAASIIYHWADIGTPVDIHY